MRRAAKVDANQDEIVQALRHLGASVVFIGFPLDLIVGYRGKTLLMEVKNPDAAPKLTQDQVKFLADWRGQWVVVESVDHALNAILGERDGWPEQSDGDRKPRTRPRGARTAQR